MSAAMYEFTSLESSARFYDAVMTMAEIYRQKLSIDILNIRHEDVLTSFEAKIRRVCAFLGMDWREEMRGFATQRRTRDINTPSAAQIARGLSKDGVGQWRRYREQLAPVLSMLAPWVERFGYPRD